MTVSARVTDHQLALMVSDDGIGMDSETQSHIFEPFYTARRDDSGTGLGMPVVRHAVHALGGHITVNSEPDEGTTVIVRIPTMSKEGDILSHPTPSHDVEPVS